MTLPHLPSKGEHQADGACLESLPRPGAPQRGPQISFSPRGAGSDSRSQNGSGRELEVSVHPLGPRFSLLAKQWMRVLGVGQMLPKCVACALRPELLGDVAAGVDEYVRHVLTTILVAGDDEVPDVTRIRLSIWGRECLALAMGITQDDERCSCLECVDYTEVGTWSVPPVRTVRGVVPNVTRVIMIGHGFENLLFSFQRRG